jgi:putative peptidoglycan lipid II flippase
VSTTAAPPSASATLARSGTAIALGTVASRLTGFLRTVALGAAIGAGGIANAYNIANTVPNALYDLLLGGVLTSVIVPLLVQAAHDDPDDGDAYAQRLMSMVTVGLAIVAVVAVIAAPLVIAVYGHKLSPADRTLATTFARFFLPQLFFYGVGATIGAILNVRGRFAAPMWAPVLNNVVVIASCALFLAVTHGRLKPGGLSHSQTLVLAVGTTAGVVVQTIALLPALRRCGFRMRMRWDWRGAGLGRAGPFAGWAFGYVVTNQLAFVAIANFAGIAGHAKHGVGFAGYSYAFILFQLPYAVIGVTVITALFPGMSRSAAAGDEPAVASTLAEGLSVAGVILVPTTVFLILLGVPFATLVLAHGNTTLSEARLIGLTLAGFGVGLVPFSAFQMQLRAWLAVRDSRTPMLVNIGVTAVNLIADLILVEVIHGRDKIVGLGLGYSLSYAIGTVVFATLLRRRMVASAPTHVIRTHVRLVVAAVVAAVPTYVVSRLVLAHTGEGPVAALVVLAAAGGVGLVAFSLVIRRMRLRELDALLRMIPGRARPTA